MMSKLWITLILILPLILVIRAQDPDLTKYRPKFHYSVPLGWLNDPNGLVYYDGEYHLHYQFYPNDSIWGPMHWGHAVSRDLVTWEELPTALYPDEELGLIFSGSAVVDFHNSTGFQVDNETLPLVAVFTHAGETQQQSIAYSLDKGRTYTKYEGNPVIPNTEILDFRDPKVIYNEATSTWIQLLAAGDRIMFYSSPDLKTWTYLSEFGGDPRQGSHSGVWECPDLFEYPLYDGQVTLWVLIVSINPGGPNGGSATQYFVGNFDGVRFTSLQRDPLWLDWGVDNYAAVSFFDDPQGRKLMIGWMNNWDYGNFLPSEGWRGQMTLPFEVDLRLVDGYFRLVTQPAQELTGLYKSVTWNQTTPFPIVGSHTIEYPTGNETLLYADFDFDTGNMSNGASLAVCFMNNLDQELCTGLDKNRNFIFPLFLDRMRSGKVDFSSFSRRITARREPITGDDLRIQVFLDESGIEVWMDGGLTRMTALHYPDEPYRRIQVRQHPNGNAESEIILRSAVVRNLYSMDELKNQK